MVMKETDTDTETYTETDTEMDTDMGTMETVIIGIIH